MGLRAAAAVLKLENHVWRTCNASPRFVLALQILVILWYVLHIVLQVSHAILTTNAILGNVTMVTVIVEVRNWSAEDKVTPIAMVVFLLEGNALTLVLVCQEYAMDYA
jgi:hypothetical protein